MKSIDVKLGGDSGEVPSPGVAYRCALISPQRPGQWCKRAGIIHGPCPIHKTNSKWIIYRNGKLLEETIGENPGNLGLGKALLDTTPKGRSMKEKMGKVDFINIKNFCSSKDTVRKMKRQTTDQEKRVESTYTIKDLGSK